MIPFETYDFQRIKNIFNDEDESVAKWIKPALENGAILQATPIYNGKRAALHKRGRDFYFQIDGSDENFSKSLEEITEDFKYYDFDFVIEGVVSKNNSDFELDDIDDNAAPYSFRFFDTLYLNGDLEDDLLSKRSSILNNTFSNHSGYNSTLEITYNIENESHLEEFLKSYKDKTHSFQIGNGESLYTKGCHSNSWCGVGKQFTPTSIVKNYLNYSKDNQEFFTEKFQKGVSGSFTINQNDDVLNVSLQPIIPSKTNDIVSLEFETVDKSIGLKRQFEKGNQFIIGFSKRRSSDPKQIKIDSGNFKILKTVDNSTVIEFDGIKNVFKGIFHVDGISKTSFKEPPNVPTDVVYKLSYSDANIDISKRFGKVVWFKDNNSKVHKSCVPILKEHDAEERFVFGEVLVPEDIDAHGDIYSESEVRFAAHFFMENFGNTGLMHEEFINDKAVIVETFVAPVNMNLDASDGSMRKIKKGTWLIGMRVIDELLFGKVKNGELTGFSIGGIATVEELKKLMTEYDYSPA